MNDATAPITLPAEVEVAAPTRTGWGRIPDAPDRRDFRFARLRRATRTIPRRDPTAAVDPQRMPPVRDQGAIGCCTARATAAAVYCALRRAGLGRGHFDIPIAYLADRDLAGDFWVIAGVER